MQVEAFDAYGRPFSRRLRGEHLPEPFERMRGPYLRTVLLVVLHLWISSTARFLPQNAGEAARALQHELDHLNGILIIDHAALDELPAAIRELEEPLHVARQKRAFQRLLS